MVKQLLGFCLLYHVAQVHNTDTIGNIADNGKVMSNKQVGQVLLFLQVAQQVDNLRLNRHIQRRHRLVTNDKLGISSQTACNADSLALTAGKLVRIAVEEVGSQTAFFHDPHDRVLQSGAVFGIKAVRNQTFTDDLTNRHTGVQRRIRILEDKLQVTAQLAHLLIL